jgi:AcrR family transcriptional regulator
VSLFHNWEQTPTAAEARRWQLIAAGRRAVLDHGLDAFTVEDVVRLAGLAKGSFYTYFSSRDRFLDELRYALAQDIAAAARQAATGPWPGIFRRMMAAARDWLVVNEPLRALFGATYMSNPERPSQEPLVALLLDVLRAGVADGVIPAPQASDADSLQATAQMLLDVTREASARAAAAGNDAPIVAAEGFIARALRLDAGAASRATYA